VLELQKNNWGVDHRRPKSRVVSLLWSTEGRKIYWGVELPPTPPAIPTLEMVCTLSLF